MTNEPGLSEGTHNLSGIWRLIPLMQADGPTQMAIDRWLFEQHCQGLQPPTLRFYTWWPAAISLGYHQQRYPEFWRHLVWQGQPVALVRRPTGGRAVLHQGDLTYAIVASEFSANRMQAYGQICEFLIQGWQSLGVELHYGTAGRGYIHHPDCFGTATAADLVLACGAKLIGSAQLRRGKVILQHGSMRLNPDAALFQQVFEQGTEIAPLGLGTVPIEEIVAALVAAARSCFKVQFEIRPLSEQEWQDILSAASLSMPC